MTTKEKYRRRFTESFRREQVAKIEKGELSISDVSRLCDVRYNSVRKWLDKFGSKEVPPRIIVSTIAEVDKVKELTKQNDELKRLIGELHLKMVYQQGVIELAKQKLGEDFEKKIK